MMSNAIVVIVIAARFVIPLAIPRYPLPAIVAALVLDAADQSIFSAFGVEFANYQGYDKALDVFCLTIAYVSTIRNWTDGVPFRTVRFLWYYRLVGVVAFELIGARPLLLIFPNTFEYFFIFYEVVRLRWEPSRLRRPHVLGVVAGIWIVIKIPQEWWIHIAQLDVTDVVGGNPWLWFPIGAVAATAVGLFLAYRQRLPEADWPISMNVDAHPTTVVGEAADPPLGWWAPIEHPLVEKTLLVTLVCVIFAEVLPTNELDLVQLTVGVAVLVLLNSFVGPWLASLEASWASFGRVLALTGAVNVGVVVLVATVPRSPERPLDVPTSLFFVALLTLIATLYDRYRSQRLGSIAADMPELPPDDEGATGR